jgi:hypothetical protein
MSSNDEHGKPVIPENSFQDRALVLLAIAVGVMLYATFVNWFVDFNPESYDKPSHHEHPHD